MIPYLILVVIVGGFLIYRQLPKKAMNPNQVAQPPSAAPAPSGSTNTTTTAAATSWKRWRSINPQKWTGLALLAAVAAIIWWSDEIKPLLASYDWPTILTNPKTLGLLTLMAIAILYATSMLGKIAQAIVTIPFIPLLWVGVIGFVLIQIGTGINTYLSEPTERRQLIGFYGLNTANVLGQEKRISVTPLEKWQSESGAVRGENLHPNGYWQCVKSTNPIFNGLKVVFSSRAISSNKWEYEFTPEARTRLVSTGISSLEVTHFYMVGGAGMSNPCTQMTYSR